MKLCLLPEKLIDGEEGAAYNRFRKSGTIPETESADFS